MWQLLLLLPLGKAAKRTSLTRGWRQQQPQRAGQRSQTRESDKGNALADRVGAFGNPVGYA